MKFLDILRKLGVFRSGSTSATYKNAKEMPAELLQGGVFDAKKDLTSIKEIKQVLGFGKRNEKLAKSKKRLNSLVIFAVLFLLVLIVSFVILSFSFWFWIILVLGGFLLYTLYSRFFLLGEFTIWFFYLFLSLFLTFSLVTNAVYLEVTEGEDSGSGSQLLGYDKKVYKITSADGSVDGYAMITAKKNKSDKYYVSVHYDLLVTVNLPANSVCHDDNCVPENLKWSYDYAANILSTDEKNGAEKSGITTASSIKCNKDAPIEINFDSTRAWRYECPVGFDFQVPTNLFNPSLGSTYYSIEDFFGADVLELYDAANYWETDETSYTRNDYRAVNEGQKKVVEFSLNFEEVE